jgi:hypothetical protein
MFAGISSAKIDPKTCVGMWLFDEGSGAIAKDSSGNKNDGTLNNGPKWVDGKFGNALKFDGVDDYVNLPATTSNNWEGITMEAWVWLNLLPPELPASYGEIHGSNQDLYDMYEDKGNNELRCKFATTVSAERPGIPTAQLQKNQWLHISGTYDSVAGQAKIYLNGQLKDTHNLTGFINGLQYSSIGAQGGPGGPFTDFLNGLIDEVALFNVVLTADDINNIMNNGLSRALGITAVSLSDKLTTTWAAIKAH